MMESRHAYRRHLPHYQSDFRTYLVTICSSKRRLLVEQARNLALAHIVFDHSQRIWLHAAVVMPDHVHLLLTPMTAPNGWSFPLATILQGIKGASARSINLALGTEGPVWQHESFDHELRHDESVRQKAEYIAQNPVRKGLCATSDEYPWLWREWIDGGKYRGTTS